MTRVDVAGTIEESTMPESQSLHVSVRHEDDSYWATVDEFPGVFATGDDLEELRASLEEGIALVLASPGQQPPTITLTPFRPEPAAMGANAQLVFA
jgi:predicted RNase H-like HicB family nuclease